MGMIWNQRLTNNYSYILSQIRLVSAILLAECLIAYERLPIGRQNSYVVPFAILLFPVIANSDNSLLMVENMRSGSTGPWLLLSDHAILLPIFVELQYSITSSLHSISCPLSSPQYTLEIICVKYIKVSLTKFIQLNWFCNDLTSLLILFVCSGC